MPTKPEPAAGGIRYHDRVIVLGRSGSGKSGLQNHLAKAAICQVVLYDTKDEFTIPGVEPVYKPERIRWSEPVVHLIDDDCDLDDVDRAFSTFWGRKRSRGAPGHYGLVVVVHELNDLCLNQPNSTPASVSNYIRKGRAHGLGLLGGSQRPSGIPTSSRTEVQHVMTFAGGFKEAEDTKRAAGLHGIPVPEFEQTLRKIHAEHGKHAYIWTDIDAERTVIRPPLPEHLRANALATGIDPSAHKRTDTTPDAETEP
jgi:hypothetical protein